MNIQRFNRHKFMNEHLNEGSEFMQYQFGIEPYGTAGGGGAYQFAQDPRASYFNYQDSPYTDFYVRQSGLVANLNQLMKNFRTDSDIITRDADPFMEDIKEYTNLKILRIFENNNLKLNVFISFDFDGTEYYGVYKNFNGITRPKLESEIYYNPNLQERFSNEYALKLSNFFYKKLERWFIPKKGFYKNLKENNRLKDSMGQLYEMRRDQIVEVLGYNFTTDKRPYVNVKIKGKTYKVSDNDYYFFKWRFEEC